MNAAPDLTISTLKMIGSLILVLAILWFVYRWTRNNLAAGRAQGRGRLIQVIGNHYLGVKKSISIVQLPGSILVLGVSADRINLLQRIDDPDLIAQFNHHAQRKTVLNFKSHLQRLSNPMRSRVDTVSVPDRTEKQ
jgi:flagellar biogenesis protein FliO